MGALAEPRTKGLLWVQAFPVRALGWEPWLRRRCTCLPEAAQHLLPAVWMRLFNKHLVENESGRAVCLSSARHWQFIAQLVSQFVPRLPAFTFLASRSFLLCTSCHGLGTEMGTGVQGAKCICSSHMPETVNLVV